MNVNDFKSLSIGDVIAYNDFDDGGYRFTSMIKEICDGGIYVIVVLSEAESVDPIGRRYFLSERNCGLISQF